MALLVQCLCVMSARPFSSKDLGLITLGLLQSRTINLDVNKLLGDNMKLFDYVCVGGCGRRFEAITMTSDETVDCPYCKCGGCERQLGGKISHSYSDSVSTSAPKESNSDEPRVRVIDHVCHEEASYTCHHVLLSIEPGKPKIPTPKAKA